MKIHEKYMKRCIQLAKNGLGTTSPNPMVGSVIVHDNNIIGEGWHRKAGEAHAEVLAIASVSNKALLQKSTLYVSLEPCSHFGKTPPCADLIIESGIKTVVIGSTDPNPKVAGRGIKKLMEAGCEVILGIQEEASRALNKRFFTFQQKSRPYIFLKWAQTADGFIAPETQKAQQPVWITNDMSRQLVHKMRANEQAILVGTNTVVKDNPSLTTRNWHGSSPLRVIIDRKLKINRSLSVYDKSVPTLFFTEKEENSEKNLLFKTIDFNEDLPSQICNTLHQLDIQSMIVEGGKKTLASFIDSNAWDEAWIFQGNAIFGAGILAPKIEGQKIMSSSLQKDRLTILKNNKA